MKVTWSLTFWFVKSKVSNKAISELDEKHTDLKRLTEEMKGTLQDTSGL